MWAGGPEESVACKPSAPYPESPSHEPGVFGARLVSSAQAGHSVTSDACSCAQVVEVGSMKSPGFRGLVAAAVVVGLWLALSRDSDQPDPPSPAEVRESAFREIYSRLRTEHSAIPAWPEGTDSSYLSRPLPWTLDVQRRWIGESSPIIASASLLDLAEDSLGYVVVFGPYFLDLAPRTFFRLRVPAEIVGALSERRGSFLDQFLIVARIASVQRPALTMVPEVYNEEFPSAELEPGSSDYFVATGMLIAAQMIPFLEN